MKTYKTIRISQEVYEELCEYRTELEAIDKQRLSLDDTIDLLLNELAGQGH